jgi:hypothetical protein
MCSRAARGVWTVGDLSHTRSTTHDQLVSAFSLCRVDLDGDKSCRACTHAHWRTFWMCSGRVGHWELWHYLRVMCRLGQLWSEANVLSSSIRAELYRNKIQSSHPRQKGKLASIHISMALTLASSSFALASRCTSFTFSRIYFMHQL